MLDEQLADPRRDRAEVAGGVQHGGDAEEEGADDGGELDPQLEHAEPAQVLLPPLHLDVLERLEREAVAVRELRRIAPRIARRIAPKELRAWKPTKTRSGPICSSERSGVVLTTGTCTAPSVPMK